MRSKSNFRRGFDRDKWNQLKDFESGLSVLVRAALPETWDVGNKDRTLSTRPVVVNAIYAVSALDTANLSKSVLDACEGLVFHTDASVRALTAVSDRSSSASWGLVSFARLPPTSDRGVAAAASAELLNATLALLD
jgi:Holliday junction resolvase RusA-like endonuclease